MTRRTLIHNATIVNGGKSTIGSVIISGERIERIIEGAYSPNEQFDEVVDATSMLLFPGVIDDHVHFRDPGLTRKADMESESCAAAAGGVTSVFDMPNTNPQTTTIEALDDKFAHASKHCHVNYSFFFGATNDNSSMLPLLDTKKVCGVKLFMGSSTGNMLVDQAESLRKVFTLSPVIIMTHCEDSATIDANTAQVKEMFGPEADITHHPEIRSAEACIKSSQLAVDLAKQTGARLHIAHITTADELQLLSSLPIEEKRITAEVCPAHLLFSSDDYTTLGSRIKCNPAIKSPAHRDALRRALSEGLIDVIGTDHAPHTIEEKQGGCLKAMSGMPMIQFSLVSMLSLSEEGVLSKEQIAEKMCHAPARLFQVKERGYIREGYWADLVLVERREWTLTPDIIESKCKWSPLEGRQFKWKVNRTWCNGNTIYDGTTVKTNILGRAIEFQR